eukprot:767471-Hanusia_phi.AAC.10
MKLSASCLLGDSLSLAISRIGWLCARSSAGRVSSWGGRRGEGRLTDELAHGNVHPLVLSRRANERNMDGRGSLESDLLADLGLSLEVLELALDRYHRVVDLAGAECQQLVSQG